jgi:hypothetical protein
MDWDQAIAYTLTQTTQALTELQSESPPQASARLVDGITGPPKRP